MRANGVATPGGARCENECHPGPAVRHSSRLSKAQANSAGRVAAAGVAIGLVLSWWTGILMRGYLFEVAPADPAILAGSGAVVCAAAVVALVVPARRAAGLDPAQELRNP